MTFKSTVLEKILSVEIAGTNRVEGSYANRFGDCDLLVTLQKPFASSYPISSEIEQFENRDAHYPVGRGYKDKKLKEILMAPFPSSVSN